MEGRRDVWQTVKVIEEALDLLDHSCALAMTPTQTLGAMKAVRRLADRMDAEAAVWTDRAAKTCAGEKATGTPLSDYLATTEARSSRESLGVIHQASRITADPAVRDAALAGEVSPTKAAAIGRVLRELPRHGMTPDQRRAAASELIGQAATSTTRQIAGSADRVLERVAPGLAPSASDKAAQLERQRRQALKDRAFHLGDEHEGSVRFWGQLPTLEAVQLRTAIQAGVEHGRRDESDRIKALQEQRRSGALTDDQYFTARRELTDQGARSTAQRWADALIDLTRSAASPAERSGAARGGEAARLVVTFEYTDLLSLAGSAAATGARPDGTPLAPDQARRITGALETGEQIPASTLRRICCDADLIPAVLGAHSAILDVGRTRRLVTPQIRAALRLRDQTCVFPGCTIPAAVCDAHHITPWWDGGHTSLDNLVTLCRHHHGVVEPDRFDPAADQWRITLDPHTRRPQIHPPRRLARRLTGPPDPQNPGQNSARTDPAPPDQTPLIA